jgi:hypothetical protein
VVTKTTLARPGAGRPGQSVAGISRGDADRPGATRTPIVADDPIGRRSAADERPTRPRSGDSGRGTDGVTRFAVSAIAARRGLAARRCLNRGQATVRRRRRAYPRTIRTPVAAETIEAGSGTVDTSVIVRRPVPGRPAVIWPS